MKRGAVSTRPDDVVPLPTLRGGTRLVPRDSILFLQADGDYVRVICDEERFLMRAGGCPSLARRWRARFRPGAPRLRGQPAPCGGGAAARRTAPPCWLPDGREIDGPAHVAGLRRPWRGRGQGIARPRTPREELAEGTPLGDVYLGRLIGAQLRLSLLALGAFGGLVGSLPLLFLLWPALQDLDLLGVPCPCWSWRRRCSR